MKYLETGMQLKINPVMMVIFAAALGVVIDSIFDIGGPAPLGRSIAIAVAIVATVWIMVHFAMAIIASRVRRRNSDPGSEN
jgi:threonine/homoserine/homoserine lactone efflux protein